MFSEIVVALNMLSETFLWEDFNEVSAKTIPFFSQSFPRVTIPIPFYILIPSDFSKMLSWTFCEDTHKSCSFQVTSFIQS